MEKAFFFSVGETSSSSLWRKANARIFYLFRLFYLEHSSIDSWSLNENLTLDDSIFRYRAW